MKLTKNKKIVLGVAVVAAGLGLYAYNRQKSGQTNNLITNGSEAIKNALSPIKPAAQLPNDPRLKDPQTLENYKFLKQAYDINGPHTVISNDGSPITVNKTKDWVNKTAAEKGITPVEQMIRRAHWQGGADRNNMISGFGRLGSVSELLT